MELTDQEINAYAATISLISWTTKLFNNIKHYFKNKNRTFKAIILIILLNDLFYIV